MVAAMPVLDRKLLRDLARLWVQVVAIALVMACGVATIIIAVGALRSLEETRATFYDRYRFASVFASLSRAPLHLQSRISQISGVSGMELRIVKPVLLDIMGMEEPATGTAVSIPDYGEPAVNRPYIRSGRLPEAGRSGEVAVNEHFAKAHRMVPGSTFGAIINGRKRTLTVTGIVLSPEYIFTIGQGDIVPDPRRFGILFMPRAQLAGLYDMTGVFNDVALRTSRGADIDAVIRDLDVILKPYGGVGAHDRDDQISHAFLDSELTQLRGMASVIPPIFLFVAAFLVNMILSRLIALEREQIGLLKALGYTSVAIGWHYAKLVLVIALVGVGIGGALGGWVAPMLTRLYGEFYAFPFLVMRQSPDLYALAGAITAAAALVGAARSIWSAVSLPAAVAMQPPAPTRYRSLLGGLGGRLRIFSQLTIMALRHLIRWPLRTTFTILSTSLSVSILVAALFTFDAIDFMMDTIFVRAERQDATINFAQQLQPSAVLPVARLPGVLHAEPFRSSAVILRKGHRERRVAITGISSEASLLRILDAQQNVITLPPEGLVVSDRIAKLLQLGMGDLVEVELIEQGHRIEHVPITGIVQSFVGLVSYMHIDALDRLVGDGPRISGTRLLLDSSQLGELYRAVKQTPVIASVGLQHIALQHFRDSIAQNVTVMTSVYVILAVIITFGVIYNTARIQLSERARELASLRVLGFSRGEVSSVLLTELGVVALLAQPVGWGLGYFFCWAVVTGFETDMFRIPLVIENRTYAYGSIVVLSVAVLSALVVRRRIDRLDLVSVLKTRD